METILRLQPCGDSSVGRASACQAEGRGFESRSPLQFARHPERRTGDRMIYEENGRPCAKADKITDQGVGSRTFSRPPRLFWCSDSWRVESMVDKRS